MGISSDGIIFFGYCFEEEIAWVGDEEPAAWADDGWESLYAAVRGVHPPEEEYSEENKALHHAYWEKKSEICKESSCEIDLHCSYDYGMHYICIRSTNKTASRGYPEKLDPKTFEINPEWKAQLDEFCKLVGIKPEGEPSWWLTSLYG